MMKKPKPSSQPQQLPARAEVLVLLTAVFLLAAYLLLRYGGRWGETDSFVFTNAIRTMSDTARLIPEKDVYPGGYSFQSLVIFLSKMTGLSLSTLQLYGSILLMAWIVLPAWLLYRELSNEKYAALLATLFLLVQPEFLFPIARGSHEKFTRGLMLLCLYLLVKSLYQRHHFNRFAALVLAFYLSSYALITFNNLLAISFIMAMGLALVFIQIITYKEKSLSRSIQPAIRRLAYAVAICIALGFLFIFYAYEPARHHLYILQSIWDRIAVLFLEIESAQDPYQVINIGWINLPVYLMVSLANWLLLSTSALIWSWQTLGWLWHRQRPRKEGELLLWAFYGAFATIGVLSVIADFSGAISSNLQLRNFPSFVMLAVLVIAKWLLERRFRFPLLASLARVSLLLGIASLAILSTLKITNEPALSNKWVFHLPSEMYALEWAESGLSERTIWTGYDERLPTAVGIRTGATSRNTHFDVYTIEPETRDFLISDVIRERSRRLSRPLPVKADSLVTYDNGQTQIYHLRATTPYQR